MAAPSEDIVIQKINDDSNEEDSPEKLESYRQLKDEVTEMAIQWVEDAKGRIPVIATTGKGGVGKSTMINNFLELKGDQMCPTGDQPNPTTMEVKILKNDIYNITIQLVDTPGFGDLEIKIDDILKDLSEKTKYKADVLLYCASLHPTSRFNETDVKIIQSLNKAYGSEIWKHTILVLTFANADNRKHKSEEEYKELIKAYAARFQAVLRKAKIKNVEVQSIFSQNGSQGENKGKNNVIIPAIPIGFDPIDKSLECGQNWSDILLQEILNRSEREVAIQLLKWKGLLSPETTIAAVELTGSIMAGAATGGALGAAAGAPIGGFGIGPGAAIGSSVGAIAGAALWLGKYLTVKRLRRKQEEKQDTKNSGAVEQKTTGETGKNDTVKAEKTTDDDREGGTPKPKQISGESGDKDAPKAKQGTKEQGAANADDDQEEETPKANQTSGESEDKEEPRAKQGANKVDTAKAGPGKTMKDTKKEEAATTKETIEETKENKVTGVTDETGEKDTDPGKATAEQTREEKAQENGTIYGEEKQDTEYTMIDT